MRRVYKADLLAIDRALRDMLAKSPAPQMQYADIPTALAYIINAAEEDRAVIHEGYLILVDVGCDWYSKTKYLIEQLILKVYPTVHRVDVAIKELDWLAQVHGCSAIAVGDTQIGYLVPKYEAAGFSKIGTQLFKHAVQEH